MSDDARWPTRWRKCERVNAGAPITVFEVITAVAVPAVRAHAGRSLRAGGRARRPRRRDQRDRRRRRACAITSISLDHRELLGDTLAEIAAEKAGIMKPGVPVAIGAQPPEVLGVLRGQARRVGAPLLAARPRLDVARRGAGLRYRGRAPARWTCRRRRCPGRTRSTMPASRSPRCAPSGLGLPPAALGAGSPRADWPARLQRLHGALAALLPPDWELWLDGGHNPGGGRGAGRASAGWRDRPLHLIVGMKQAKDAPSSSARCLPRATTLWAVAEPGQHLAQPVEAIIAASGGVARPGPTVLAALDALPRAPGPARVLICGSLYLAGEVLKADAG